MENYQSAPVRQLSTNRGVIKTLLLSLITFGIYGLIVYGKMSEEINIVATKYDGKKTMSYYLMFFVVSPLTLGIAGIVWWHNFSARIGNELARRNIDYSFGAGSFWLWNVLGTFILIGPIVYIYKLHKSMNLINEHYNTYG